MGTDTDGDGIDLISDQSTGLTAAQGDDMREHCSVSLPSPPD
jgi:hypothetical protein